MVHWWVLVHSDRTIASSSSIVCYNLHWVLETLYNHGEGGQLFAQENLLITHFSVAMDTNDFQIDRSQG
jgi:hypothetical protein